MPGPAAPAAATSSPASDSHPDRAGPPDNADHTGPIARIGAAFSLSGSARSLGVSQRSGVMLAEDEINSSHLLGDTRLEVTVADDGSNRDQASVVFHRFIENSHVVAIMGPTLSDTALSVDPLAQQAAIPVLAISNSANGITQIGNFIFRDCLSDAQITPRVIETMHSNLKLDTAGLLYADTDPNRAGSHGFKSALQNLGVRITAERTFGADQTDFAGPLDDIAAARPDALFIAAPASTAASILVQARRHGFDGVPIVGSNAFNSDAVLRSAGDAAEGLIVGSAWSPGGPSSDARQFAHRYRARYGTDPDELAAEAYAGVYILAAALQNAHTATDARAVRDALEQLSGVSTPLGSFAFTNARDAAYPATVQVVHRGQFQAFGLVSK
jgi:branched-chain amino acid transport system substrate-binding protein